MIINNKYFAKWENKHYPELEQFVRDWSIPWPYFIKHTIRYLPKENSFIMKYNKYNLKHTTKRKRKFCGCGCDILPYWFCYCLWCWSPLKITHYILVEHYKVLKENRKIYL